MHYAFFFIRAGNVSVETIQRVAEEEAVAAEAITSISKARQGRPILHAPEGRLYLLKDEVKAARANPEIFQTWLLDTYSPSDSRAVELGKHNVDVTPSLGLTFTLAGSVLIVLAEVERIVQMYTDKNVEVRLGKQPLVSLKHLAYHKPKIELTGKTSKGKPQERVLFQEFHPYNICAYITIS